MTCSFVNHWFGPYCYTQIIGHTMWIRAVRNIKLGEELTCTITPTVSGRFNAAAVQTERRSYDGCHEQSLIAV